MYKLYNVKRWGSLSPHMLLDALGVPYENVWMRPEEVRAPAFRQVSPLGFIPALGLPDGRTIFESLAIMVFLTSAHPEKGMAPPAGTSAHGEYLAWLSFLSANVYGSINLAFHGEAYAPDAAAFEHLKQVATKESQRLFGIVEDHLAKRGPFLLGGAMSAADLYLYMMTIWAKPSEAELLAAMPRIAGLSARVKADPRFASALKAHELI